MDFELEYAIIRLHNIARLVEQRIGKGAVSDEIRRVADRLHEVVHAVL